MKVRANPSSPSLAGPETDSRPGGRIMAPSAVAYCAAAVSRWSARSSQCRRVRPVYGLRRGSTGVGPKAGETPAGQISTFGIADRTEPGVATFAVHPDDFDATAARAAEAGVHLGEIRPLSRRTPGGELLQWRLTRGEGRDPDPSVPFLIDWGTAAQPGLGSIPTLELLSWLSHAS